MIGARFLAPIAVLFFAATASAAAADTAASAWADNDAGRVRLESAATATGDADALPLGLHFALKPGWKIYWRSPGDAGYPPRLDWSGSDNAGPARIAWPAPKRFELAGLQNHGYDGEVILPLSISVATPGQAVALRLRLDYLACSDICVPMETRLALDLPAGPALLSAWVHDIGRFSARVPGDGAHHGLELIGAWATAGGLRLDLQAKAPFNSPDLFIEAEGTAGFGKPNIRLSQGGHRLLADLPVIAGTQTQALEGAEMILTLVDGEQAMESTFRPQTGTSVASEEGDGDELVVMLGLALLGGFILNLMPCVAPVLSIKVLGVMAMGGADRRHVRASFLASAAGIIVSFLVLAAIAIALKLAGASVGWGIQFQQPLFLAAMVVLLSLFAASLWGFWDVPMPGWLLRSKGPGKGHHTLLGHFLSGTLATVLATPCSAPFLGTAVGFALARGPIEILLVFAVLGTGMALPFLAMAVWPEGAGRLPKPGAWMVVARAIMGVALAVTALWLLWVLAGQTGTGSALTAGASMIAAVLLLGLRPRLPHGTRLAALVAVAGLSALALVAPLGESERRRTGEEFTHWVTFDRDAIPGLVAQGKIVLVDVTADWCITCKVNKAAVLERDPVAARLAAEGVVAMKADWTNPDEAITRFLADHGRYGIPFDIVFGPGAPAGVALSELLSESETLAALTAAARP